MGAAGEARVSAGWRVSGWAVTAAFGTYFCMYAFRKPFTAAEYPGLYLWGLKYKIVLVTAQMFGYMLSKFAGIKVVAEVEPRRRVVLLIALIAVAEAALLLFGLTPAPWNFFWLFCNGVPLGMVFGLVLGFLEGRRHTEALAAGLCASFIVADDIMKAVGAELLRRGVSEFWMPAAAGLIFLPALLLFSAMLTRIPQPSPADIAARSQRLPMDAAQRRRFFWKYAPGLSLLVLVYVLITILRSVRSDFAPEIWNGLLGKKAEPEMYAWTGLAVAAGVLVLVSFMILLRDNRRAFFVGLALAMLGCVLVGAALLALREGILPPFPFMVLLTIGLYLPYIAVHTTLFERLIAMTREHGNIGFLMYLADAFGYLGYVGVLLVKNASGPVENFLDFFFTLSAAIAALSLVLLIPCGWYFATHPATRRDSMTNSPQ